MQPALYTELMEPTDEMVDPGDSVVKEGYAYKVMGGVPPFKSTGTWTVTAFDPKTLQVHDGDDGKVKSIPIDGSDRPTRAVVCRTRRSSSRSGTSPPSWQ